MLLVVILLVSVRFVLIRLARRCRNLILISLRSWLRLRRMRLVLMVRCVGLLRFVLSGVRVNRSPGIRCMRCCGCLLVVRSVGRRLCG